MGKYIVTYCVTDEEVGSNPLWHACNILSYWPGSGERIKMINGWGFYGQKSPERSFRSHAVSLFFKRCKKAIGCKVDPKTIEREKIILFNTLANKVKITFELKGNPGSLKREEIRFFDRGKGLHGIHIPISEEQASKLTHIYETRIKNQACAIAEATEYYIQQGKFDPTPREILEYEENRAKAEDRVSRLPRFEGLSSTCKGDAIQVLEDIGIDKAYLAKLQEISKNFPRFSGELERIYFHSRGPTHEYHKDDVHVSLYRCREDGELFYAVPPQLMMFEDSDLKKLKLPVDYVDTIKFLVSRLLMLEKIFEHEAVVNNRKGAMELVEHIHDLYKPFSKPFSKVKVKDSQEVIDLQSMEAIERRIDVIKDFFKDLGMAIGDEWSDDEEVETVAAKLPEDVQKSVSKIIDPTIFEFKLLGKKLIDFRLLDFLDARLGSSKLGKWQGKDLPDEELQRMMETIMRESEEGRDESKQTLKLKVS